MMTLNKKRMNSLKTDYANSKVEHLLSMYYEDQLAKQVSKIFNKMKKKVIVNLHEYYDPEVMFQAHMDLILEPIQELHKEYYETLLKFKIREFDKSRASGKRIVERMIGFRRKGNVINKQFTFKADIHDMVSSTISKDKLFGTSEIAHDNLATRTYQLSERTLSRVDSQINDIITKGYDSGKGIDAVSHEVEKRFNQLESWEATRIARTEIHNSNTLGVIQGYDDLNVEYIQWSSAGPDGRTRDSHLAIDGEIIPMGATFSNGLMYPGDMNGSAEEVINCRCQALPFIIPYGYIAPPDMIPFKEEDLIAADVPDYEGLLEYVQFDESSYAIDTASNEFVGWSDKLQRDELGGKLEMEQILAQENEGYTIDELLSEETYALEYWCEEGSSEISNVIYNGVSDEYAEDAMPILDDLIETSPGLNHHTKLHAGMILDESLEVGETGVLQGYQSTSFFKEGAEPYARSQDRWLVEVYAKEGQKGVCMNAKNGNGFTNYPDEHEYLLPRNQKYVIIEKNVETHTAKILLID